MVRKSIIFNWGMLCVFTLLFIGCGNELHMTLPQGPEGPAGKSAYEIWKEAVEDGTIDWPGSDVNNFFLYIKGEKGDKGDDGKSAYDLWKEEVEKGNITDKNGDKWDTGKVEVYHFWEYLSGADGQDGLTPEIGDNGNWWIGDTDTGVPAKGQDGEDGEDGQDGKDGLSPYIKDGNWWIGDTNTGVPATGQSAYEIWVQEVCGEGLLNPHVREGDEGYPSYWSCSDTALSDFWEYLRGADGKDGDTVYTDGEVVVIGKPNVLARYYQHGISNSSEYKEYIDATNGSVRYTVYNVDGAVFPNAQVRIMIGDQLFEGQSNNEGDLFLPKEYLPESTAYRQKSQVYIVGEDGVTSEWADTPVNTYIPIRAQVRFFFGGSSLVGTTFSGSSLLNDNQSFKATVLRSMDGGITWELLPEYLAYESVYCALYNVTETGSVFDTNYSGVAVASGYTSSFSSLSTGDGVSVFSVKRSIKATNYFTPNTARIWDGDNHYYAMYLDQLYGLQLTTENVCQALPIQPCPLIADLKIDSEKFNSDRNLYVGNEVTGNIIVNEIDTDLFFDENLVLDSSSFDVPCYVGSIDSAAAEAHTTQNILRLVSYKSFNGGGSYSEYSGYMDIFNNQVKSPYNSGFHILSIYEQNGALYIPLHTQFYRAYFYRITRTDDRTWLFTGVTENGQFTSSYNSYKNFTVVTTN